MINIESTGKFLIPGILNNSIFILDEAANIKLRSLRPSTNTQCGFSQETFFAIKNIFLVNVAILSKKVRPLLTFKFEGCFSGKSPSADLVQNT